MTRLEKGFGKFASERERQRGKADPFGELRAGSPLPFTPVGMTDSM
jgi:hypothetical protein